ncbi:unnamed protein product [Periconia digitata]|uniref:Uncharacterized protein n=1 Tax=Periconia digitata TaxID=1303443 RepID=A0A9W4URN6_9PLEO|nr:unnamed protein product [Periconia digitata]
MNMLHKCSLFLNPNPNSTQLNSNSYTTPRVHRPSHPQTTSPQHPIQSFPDILSIHKQSIHRYTTSPRVISHVQTPSSGHLSM